MENSPIESIVEMHFLSNLRTVSYLLIWKLIRLSKPQKSIKNLPRMWAFWSLAWASYALAASPAPCRVRHCWKAWFEPPLCMEFPSVWDKLRHKTGIHLRGSFKGNPMKPSSLALNIFHIHGIYLNFSLKSPLLRVPWLALLWAPGTSLPAGGFMRFYAMFSWNKVVSLRDTRTLTIGHQFFFVRI